MQGAVIVAKSMLTIFLLHLLLAVGTQSQGLPQPNVVAALPSAISHDAQLNITSSADDYVRKNQRHYAANIVDMDVQLAALKSSYDLAMSTISTQKELLLAKLLEVDNKLYTLESLNDLSKHCVQKYSGNLTSAASVQLSISKCAQAGFSYYSATTQRNGLNSFYNGNLLNAVIQCKRLHLNPSFNYSICVTQAISQADATTAGFLKNFNTQMQTARCSADARIKQAVDCSFTIVYGTVTKVGEVTRLIENCAKGLEFCPACEEVLTTPAPRSCPNELTLRFNSLDYRNATISNPFYGFSSNTSCILINIIPSYTDWQGYHMGNKSQIYASN